MDANFFYYSIYDRFIQRQPCVCVCVIVNFFKNFSSETFDLIFTKFHKNAGSKKFQNSYASTCHFALVLQLDKEGSSTCPDQIFPSKDERMCESLDSGMFLKYFSSPLQKNQACGAIQVLKCL